MHSNPGGKARSYDNRDLKLGSAVAPLISSPAVYQSDVAKVRKLFQNGWPACGSHAGAHLKEIQELKDVDNLDGCSPRYLWRKIKDIDGCPPEDGTDMRSIFEALATKGVCGYSALPNPDVPTSLTTYSNPYLSSSMDAEAQFNIIKTSYGFLPGNPSVQTLHDAIYTYGAVLLLIRCDDGFWGTQYPSFTTKKYGHFVVAYGYDASSILILDSTEVAFPLKAIFNSYLPFIQEVGTTTDVPYADIKASLDKINLLTRLVQLYKQVIALKNQMVK